MLHLDKLEQVLEEIITRWGIPGLGIGIVEGEEITYARGFGVQSLDTQVQVTPESIFGVVSVSKCFVATAVMRLAEQGKIDLDTPIVQYLPYFRLDDERFTQITTRLILSHTSGMPDMDEYERAYPAPFWDVRQPRPLCYNSSYPPSTVETPSF